MADTKTARPKARPGANMRLIEALQYRLPIAAQVSILHRASGVIMVLLLPFVIWLFDKSVTSEASYDAFTAVFAVGFGVVPAFVVKLAVLALIWSFLHHISAGLRHLWMDATHSVTKQQGSVSAQATMVISLVLTVALGAKLFNLF